MKSPSFPDHIIEILQKRYFLSGDLYKKYYDSKFAGMETWNDLCWRVASAITNDEFQRKTFFDMMYNLEFLPNSPTLFGAGLPGLCLSACFIIPVEDSIEGWANAYRIAMRVQTHGGGCGFPLHKIRPKGFEIVGKRAKAAGPIEFMRGWNQISKSFSQGPRSGANMGQMRCLRGNTLIHTLHGKIPIKDLVGKTPLLYCVDEETRNPHIEKCEKIFVSATSRKLFRVYFDNDDYIDCTGDHKFLLSSGKYTEASSLQRGDSLVAFHKTIVQHGTNKRFDYQIGFTGGTAIRQYQVVAQDILGETTGKDWHPHHKDENSLNDDPSNLMMVNRSDHASEHLQNVKILQQKTAEKRRGRKLEDIYPPEVVAVWKKRMSDAAKRRIEKKKLENHKVVCVVYLGIVEEDVYDIQMPKHHNFVANGVVVHNCDHPDIEEFIDCKLTDGDLSAFNISVMITNEFMNCVKTGKPFDLVWNGKVIKSIDAKALWDKIIINAWKNGEPGIMFYDQMQASKHPSIEGELLANPCAEYNGPEGGACNLGSINLSKCIVSIEGEKCFDFNILKDIAKKSYYFLNSVINVNHYPDPTIEAVVKKYRQIGVGVMGLHDVFLALGYVYGDVDSIIITEKIFSAIRETLTEENEKCENPNTMMMSIAPTGTISMIAGVSSGIEPHFSFEPIKRIIAGETVEVHTIQKSSYEPANVSANEIPPERHLAITAAVQKYVDMSISKTINLPRDASVEDVKKAYETAFDLGLKGATVYRDGSRANQTIQTSASYEKEKEEPRLNCISPVKREGILDGKSVKDKLGCGNLYTIINWDENGNILEVFVKPGKLTGCLSNSEGLGRMITLALRCGAKVDEVIKQIKGIRCPSCLKRPGIRFLSCPDAVARALEFTYNKLINKVDPELPKEVTNPCPECKKQLISEGGCLRCLCGWTKCG